LGQSRAATCPRDEHPSAGGDLQARDVSPEGERPRAHERLVTRGLKCAGDQSNFQPGSKAHSVIADTTGHRWRGHGVAMTHTRIAVGVAHRVRDLREAGCHAKGSDRPRYSLFAPNGCAQ
jgi:hypothetical protein